MHVIHLSEGACEVCVSVSMCVQFRVVGSLRKQREIVSLWIKLNCITLDWCRYTGHEI